jgi:anti-sigma28 factor (negative regulator of flagellin synthesis)
MDLSKPVPIGAVVHRMVEESEKRASRLAALREAIAAGTYGVSADAVADSVERWMRS